MPRDDKGRFVPLECPDPNCDGTLHLETNWGHKVWHCYGLVIPADDGVELEACTFTHADGEPYRAAEAAS